MTKEEIKSATKHTLNNRHEIEKSKMCGCYYCMRTFPASLITDDDYILGGRTALCPLCSVDAVIGDASGVPINKKVLTEIYHVQFGNESLTDNVQDEKDKHGLINEQGTETIPGKWKSVGSLSPIDGFAIVWNDDYKCGLVDKNGKVVIPCIWLDAEHFSEGLAAVVNDDVVAKFSQNDDLKQLLLSPEYEGRGFVEASPYDKVWGVRMYESNPDIDDESKWKGLNLLGKVLDETRRIIIEEDEQQ